MRIAEVKVGKTTCETMLLVPIPRGIVGATISIEYTDPAWDGLQKTVVFRSAVTKDVLDSGNEVVIPAEVVSRAGRNLYMGVYGVDAANNVVIPTIWAELGPVNSAAAPSGDASSDPALPVWAQIQGIIGNLDDLDTAAKNSLVAAVNEALAKGVAVDEAEIRRIVEDYLAANPPAPGEPGKDGRGITSITGNADGSWQISYNDGTTETVSNEAYQAIQEKLNSLSEEIADGVSWNELKDKPFYLEKTLVVELTKDDFTVNDQDGYIKYMYRSTPKLDWFSSAESIAFEIEIVDTNGRRYTATQDSIGVHFENDNTDDGSEYWACYSDLFDIVSGVDLDFYDDEYYYKDEWGVLAGYAGTEFSEINIKIYRVDVKKIPKICLDAAIGKTAITVGEVLDDSESEMMPSVIVPDLRIPISPSSDNTEIYFDRISGRLRISAGELFPYNGKIRYTVKQVIPTTAGSSISFDISSEGDALWDTIGENSRWAYGGYLSFTILSSYIDGGLIEFLSRGVYGADRFCAVAASTIGNLYMVLFKYTNSYKTLNVTIKCVA